MAKEKKTALVKSQECLGTDIFTMWIQAGDMAGEARPFYNKALKP